MHLILGKVASVIGGHEKEILEEEELRLDGFVPDREPIIPVAEACSTLVVLASGFWSVSHVAEIIIYEAYPGANQCSSCWLLIDSHLFREVVQGEEEILDHYEDRGQADQSSNAAIDFDFLLLVARIVYFGDKPGRVEFHGINVIEHDHINERSEVEFDEYCDDSHYNSHCDSIVVHEDA